VPRSTKCHPKERLKGWTKRLQSDAKELREDQRNYKDMKNSCKRTPGNYEKCPNKQQTQIETPKRVKMTMKR